MAFGQPFGSTPSLFGQPAAAPGEVDLQCSDGPTDGISAISWSPASDNLLAASSWDGKVRIYQTGPAQTPSPPLAANKVAEYAHAPQPGTLGALLDIAWSRDGTKIYSVGTDKRGFIWDSASQQQVQFAQHAEPIKCVRVVSLPTDPNSEFVCTASWDKTLKYWDPRQQKEIASIALNDRAYAMDYVAPWLVVACADRHIGTCNTQQNPGMFNWTFSTLKWQTRVISCFPLNPDDLTAQEKYPGYAIGSIEGRVGIVYHDQAKANAGNFSFKCHRVELKGKTQLEKDTEKRKMQQDGTIGQLGVYAVNSIAFNRYNTFVTAGADGTMVTWEHYSKARLKQFDIKQGPISTTAFSRDASMLAYAVSYDWSQGHMGNTPERQQHRLMVHKCKEDEVKRKPVKR